MNLVQKFPEFCAKFIYRKSLQNLETVWGEGRGRIGLSGFVGGGGRETPGGDGEGWGRSCGVEAAPMVGMVGATWA